MSKFLDFSLRTMEEKKEKKKESSHGKFKVVYFDILRDNITKGMEVPTEQNVPHKQGYCGPPP